MMKTEMILEGKGEAIHVETNPNSIPGDLYKSFIYKGKDEAKKIGGILWSYLRGDNGEKYCILHMIRITGNYRRIGIATLVLTEFLQDFDDCVTEVDSKAGLELLLKCGFKTDDQKNYLWRNENIKERTLMGGKGTIKRSG